MHPTITFLDVVVMELNVFEMEIVRGMIAAVLSAVILGNIPTLILLAIYFACCRPRRMHIELDKMRINDL